MVSTIIHTPTNHDLVIPSKFKEINSSFPLADTNSSLADPSQPETEEKKEIKAEEMLTKTEEISMHYLIIFFYFSSFF
jgi:hypothetical protein